VGLPVREQTIYWGSAALVLFLVLWILGDVILPFVLGGAIAYFLDPVADRLERLGLGRAAATSLITLMTLVIVVLLAVLVVPQLIEQTRALVQVAPQLAHDLQAFLTRRFPQLVDAESPVRQSLLSLGDTLKARGGQLVEGLLTSAMTLLNVLVLLVIVPVVAFYLLLDWDRMVARVDELLPRDHAPTIRKLAREIDRTLASFIRGQGTVCLLLGTYYAAALMAVGLQFGLIVGFIAGLLTFIPYVGALVGGGLAVGLALFQFWGDWVWIVAVAAIFQAGQIVEGNVLTPKLVGSSVGLHPAWLIFALSVFGALFGFVGMLVAVPVAAAIGVLVRFAIERYERSLLYTGDSSAPSATPDAPADRLETARRDRP
jgi:predicted PurR-regulated permease PerM